MIDAVDLSEYPMLADLRRQAVCLKAMAARYPVFSNLGSARLAAREHIVAFGSGAAALGSMGMTTIAIETPSCPVPGATLRFTLPEVPERISPLFAAIPLQFIGYYLARAFGANPDQSQDVGDPARFRAAQLLARRGELAAELR